MSKYVLVLSLSALMACPGGGKDTGDTSVDSDADTDADSDTDADTDADPTTVEATLTADGVTIAITNGVGDYEFGIVQKGTEDNWTGEDCHLGYDTADGNLQFCHTLGPAGGDLTLGALPLANDTTLFYDGLPGTVGYYIADSTGACYVWGAEASHWADLGCATM